MASFSKFLASRLAKRQPPFASHPDAETLTAFTENCLPSAERQSVLAHLGACSHCREIVSLAAAANPLAVRPSTGRLTLRYATAAALSATCLLVFTVSRHRPASEPKTISIVPAVAPPSPAAQPIPATQASPISQTRIKEKKKVFVAPSAQLVVVPKSLPAPVPEMDQPLLERETDRASSSSEPTSTVNLLPVPAAPPPPAARSLLPQSNHAVGFAPQRAISKFAVAKQMLAKQQSLWSIQSEDGTLSRSDDGGQTWIPVGKTGILSLSVAQGDIWAGGSSGALFHSTDNGATWRQVIVSAQLNEPILAISRSGGQIRLRTKSGDWLSSDGGVSWINELTH